MGKCSKLRGSRVGVGTFRSLDANRGISSKRMHAKQHQKSITTTVASTLRAVGGTQVVSLRFCGKGYETTQTSRVFFVVLRLILLYFYRLVGRNAGIQGDESSYVVVLHVKTVWMNDVEVSINDDVFHKLGTVIRKGVSS